MQHLRLFHFLSNIIFVTNGLILMVHKNPNEQNPSITIACFPTHGTLNQGMSTAAGTLSMIYFTYKKHIIWSFICDTIHRWFMMPSSMAAIFTVLTIYCPYEATVGAKGVDRNDNASKYGFVVCVQNVTIPHDMPRTPIFIQHLVQIILMSKWDTWDVLYVWLTTMK